MGDRVVDRKFIRAFNLVMRKNSLLTALIIVATGVATLGRVLADTPMTDSLIGRTLDSWQVEVFNGETRYTIVENNSVPAIKAESHATASGLFREMTVDLTITPCLHWAWKVDDVLGGLDETTKPGDDFPARVYVVISGGLFFWNTRALNYVWSGSHPTESSWPNPYTDRSTMVAVQSGPVQAGQWIMESRNVRDDFKRFAGVDAEKIDAVAIMTDTDDSGLSATAYYRDIRFSAACVP